MYHILPYTNFHDLNLDWILNTVKKLEADVEYVKNYFDNIDKEIDDKVAEAVAPVFTEMASLSNQLNTRMTNLQTALTNRMDTIELENSSYWANAQVQFDDIWRKINTLQFELPEFINPYNGLMEQLQKILFDIYLYPNMGWITAGEFDTLNETGQSFDAYQFNAAEFDRNAKTILM